MAISGLFLRSHGIKSHSDVGAAGGTENTIWGKVMTSPEFGPW
jgi:hypothetical protein